MGIIEHEVDDPDLRLLSIVRVEATADLEEAKVYFSLLDQKQYLKCKKALKKMKGFIKSNLAKKIRLRKMPELSFLFDDSISYSVGIHKKIEELKDEEDKK